MKNPFRRPPPAPRPRRRPGPPPEADEAPLGCGWFDSSHALVQGLLVREVQSAADLAAAVPLGWWLDWENRRQAGPP